VWLHQSRITWNQHSEASHCCTAATSRWFTTESQSRTRKRPTAGSLATWKRQQSFWRMLWPAGISWTSAPRLCSSSLNSKGTVVSRWKRACQPG
jgi:hypothetical protein